MYGALGITLKEEKCLIGSDLRNTRFTCCKKYIVRKKIHTYGLLNGGYKSLFSSFSSSKAGVSILFNNNFDLQIMKTFIDDSGRLILCDLKTNGKSITLANIYAPNEDDPAFFKNLLDHLEDFEGEEIIIGGDFNLVLDVEKDEKGGLPRTHHNAQKTIYEICDNLELVDAWRILNPEERRYT